MKKIIIVLLVISLVGCSQGVSQENFDAMKAEMSSLRVENDDLKDKIEDLNAIVSELTISIEDMNVNIAENKDMMMTYEEKLLSPHAASYNSYMASFAYEATLLQDGYSQTFGHLISYDAPTDTITFNTVEFVSVADEERIAELNIQPDHYALHDTYIYFHEDEKTMEVGERAKVYVYNHKNDLALEALHFAVFLRDYDEYKVILHIESINDKVVRLTEIFLD